MTVDPAEYLFEKVFFQAAHIAILDEALETARTDLIELAKKYNLNIKDELMKIQVAYESVAKLKKGSVK